MNDNIPHVRNVVESNLFYDQAQKDGRLFVVVEKDGKNWKVHADTFTARTENKVDSEMAERCRSLYQPFKELCVYLHANGHHCARTANAFTLGSSWWNIPGIADIETADAVARVLREALLGDRSGLDAMREQYRPSWDDGTLDHFMLLGMLRRCSTCKAPIGVRCTTPKRDAKVRKLQAMGLPNVLEMYPARPHAGRVRF